MTSQAGSRDALWHLGYHYLKGRGVKADKSKAFEVSRLGDVT